MSAEGRAVRREFLREGGHARLTIDRPKGNVISLSVIRELIGALEHVALAPHTKLVTIEGVGEHFSYGASVEEHRPATIRKVLPELHELVRAVLAVPAPTAAIVRGRCLGGGFEVALACDLIFADTTAVLGVPEITLGVFPPAASALLPARVGASRAAGAILTGAVRPAADWSAAGLVEAVVPPQDLDATVSRWYEVNIAPRSAAALRCAATASRAAIRRDVDALLPGLERFYLETLMRTNDAVEGISAFLDRRAPAWTDT